MAQRSAGTAVPSGLRVVQRIPGESLIVALPLPSNASVPQHSSPSNTFAVAAALPTHDRAFWTRFSYTPLVLKISTILRGLGLRQLNTGPGRILFKDSNVGKLADAVAEAIKRLPTTLEGLLDAASSYDYAPLHEETVLLLSRFGEEIWGSGKKRPWLLQASDGHSEYQKDLIFGDAADHVVMIYYLRLWILVKAFNSLRHKVNPSAKVVSKAGANGQSQRSSARHFIKPMMPPSGVRTLTSGNPFAATTDRVATSSEMEIVPTVTQEPTALLVNNNAQMRRTARMPKPRKDIVNVEYDSDGSTDARSLEEDTADDIPRHYKGKGRARKKSEADEDPAFISKKVRSSSKLRTSDFQPNNITRSRARPKERKSTKVLRRGSALDGESDHDAMFRADREESRSKRREKETLSTPAQISVFAQRLPDQNGSRRLRRKYLSEEVVRNSSDEYEDDGNIFTQATIEPAMGDKVTPRSRPHHGGEPDTPVKTASGRQPPGACESCRRRRQRCDRTRPECGRCAHHGFPCKYLLSPTSTTLVELTSRPSPREEQAVLLSHNSPEHVDSGHDPSGQSATNGTLQLRKVDLPLDKDWDEERWQYFYLRVSGDDTMLATMRSLGLKVIPRNRANSRFVIENFVPLGKDVCKIARKLCNKFSAAELIHFAADPSYLDEEIDVTLDTYSYVWAMDADRTKLLTPGSDPLYAKHLSYEDNDDRKLLWIHLHRWTFMIALKNCKQMYGAGVRNMNKVINTKFPENMLDQWQLEGTYTFDEPDELGTASQPQSNASTSTDDQPLEPVSDSAEDMFADPTLQEHETHLLEAIGQMFAEEKMEQLDNETTNAAESKSTTRKPSRRRQKRKDSSVATPEQPDIVRPHKQRRFDRTRPKGYDFSALFMSYLENFAEPNFNELAGLESITNELSIIRDYANGLDTKKVARLSTTAFVVTFSAWLSYRREIVEVKRKIAAMQPPEESLNRQVAIMERNRLATHLRKTYETFMGAGHDDLRPEQVIYRAMITLMNEHGDSKAAEDIRRGFMRMEDEFTGLGDQLIKVGGAQYVMGNFASVILLKDLQPHAKAG